MSIQGLGVASDDVGDGAPAGIDAVALQRPGDVGDVAVQAVLGDQHRDQQSLHPESDTPFAQAGTDQRRQQADPPQS